MTTNHPSTDDDLIDFDDGNWVECWQCGGFGDLDGECTCGEDTCCCLYPEAPTCDICGGKGGYYVPEGSEPAKDEQRS